MRLLNTKTLKPQWFNPKDIPEYAILSHTWGDEEITLQDLTDEQAVGKKGFEKVHGCCARARADGFSWVWIDTCCIDKSSSAELSEAINSMYAWYERAVVCYAYLSDVPPPSPIWDPLGEDEVSGRAIFKRSNWFRRGWTLQEVIAPRHVEFYCADWSELGTKHSLRSLVEWATNIDAGVLSGSVPPGECSVMKRMSWASTRETTRPEDMAYCLLGIFDVNMPMLYGEGGERAFYRLQEEILRRNPDMSLFAWRPRFDWDHALRPKKLGMLASTPIVFGRNICHTEVRGGHIDLHPHEIEYLPRRALSGSAVDRLLYLDPPTVTNRGLRISLYVKETKWDFDYNLRERRAVELLAWLSCVAHDRLLCLELQAEASDSKNRELTWVRTRRIVGIAIDPERGFDNSFDGFQPRILYLALLPEEKVQYARMYHFAIAIVLSGVENTGLRVSPSKCAIMETRGPIRSSLMGPGELSMRRVRCHIREFASADEALGWGTPENPYSGPGEMLDPMKTRVAGSLSALLLWVIELHDPGAAEGEGRVSIGLVLDKAVPELVCGLMKETSKKGVWDFLDATEPATDRLSAELPGGKEVLVRVKRGASGSRSGTDVKSGRYNVLLEVK